MEVFDTRTLLRKRDRRAHASSIFRRAGNFSQPFSQRWARRSHLHTANVGKEDTYGRKVHRQASHTQYKELITEANSPPHNQGKRGKVDPQPTQPHEREGDRYGFFYCVL